MRMRAMSIALVIAMSAVVGIEDGARAQGTELGKHEYLRSCASCHGVTGKGDGPVIKSLIKPPPDLTKLSEANKGVFPFSRIFDVLDGRIEIMIHGTRDMPVWGEVYTREWNSRLPQSLVSKEGTEAMVRIRMLMLIEYIASLQGR
jgi:mono/diheme cytochrome c family protein